VVVLNAGLKLFDNPQIGKEGLEGWQIVGYNESGVVMEREVQPSAPAPKKPEAPKPPNIYK
jgi:hypothetical protein